MPPDADTVLRRRGPAPGVVVRFTGGSVTIRYPEARRTYTKSLPCPHCGRKVRRQRTFSQTLNPFRRDGAKTLEDVYKAIHESDEVAQWTKRPEWHGPCRVEADRS